MTEGFIWNFRPYFIVSDPTEEHIKELKECLVIIEPCFYIKGKGNVMVQIYNGSTAHLTFEGKVDKKIPDFKITYFGHSEKMKWGHIEYNIDNKNLKFEYRLDAWNYTVVFWWH